MGLHHHDGEDEEEHHSIASLRSKFESLAHGHLHRERGQVSAPTRAAVRSPPSPTLGGRVSTPPPSGLAGRPLSPASGAQFNGATISTSSSTGSLSDSGRRPPPSSYKPPLSSFAAGFAPKPTPKPVAVKTTLNLSPAVTRTPSPSSSISSLPAPLRAARSPSPSRPLEVDRATAPPSLDPRPNEVPSVNVRKATLEVDDSGEPDDDSDLPQSVSALRQRFGQAITRATKPARGDSPTITVSQALREANDARAARNGTPLATESSLPTSPASLSEAGPPPVPDKLMLRPAADTTPPPSQAPSAQHTKGPAPPPPQSRSTSRPASRAASPSPETSLDVASSSTSSAPSSRPSPPQPRTASSLPLAIPIPAGRPPPPPPPQATSPQPMFDESVPVSSTPPFSMSLAASPQPVHITPSSRRPPPPRPGSPQPAVRVEQATPQTPAKPPLPVRKATLPVGAIDAPPLPSNRPPPTRAATLLATSITDTPGMTAKPPLPGNKPGAPTVVPTGDLKPPLPQRPRGDSLTVQSIPIGTGVPPPRLPTRQNTIASVLTNSSPSPSHRARGMSISADPGFNPLPPLLRSAPNSGGANLGGAKTVSASSRLEVKRMNGGASSPGRNTSGGDSDEDEEGPTTGLSAAAQRLLDEHPDSTYANKRAPNFQPDINVVSQHSITSFAVYGRYACVAHSHVRVYDTQMDNREPILHVDQKETGLELRAKDPRVTALGFRPARNPACEGRYLWCGNKDGHLWEIDIQTGEITAIKAGSHASPVTHIMRHQHYALTLDDSGKLQVWEVPEADEKNEAGNFRLFRTMRVSDRVTFAKMIKGRLWTATAPAVRSTTNTAGVRGPTVRVYEPFAPGNAPPPRTCLTTEWTGAATSATVVPLKSDTVYVGHEGGFVTLWSLVGTELQCLQVLKVSTTDILALEGVGDHLWAGNRRGQIYVWNIDQLPWATSNLWTAHTDQPIHSLVADPHAIAATNKFVVWSCSRDSLHAWDGLRAINWIDKRMLERQPDYCDFREVRVLVVSWNIDSAKPSDLASGGVDNANFLDQVLGSVDSPDIIVFGFQEVIPLTDKKLTAKALLFGSKGKDGGGSTNDRVSGAYRAWADKLSSQVRRFAADGSQYAKVHSEQLVGLFTCMFVKTEERENLRDVQIKTVKRGIGGIYGNKGAIVARMVMDDTSMCFINVHLAAGQRHKAARNADLAAIMEDKAVFPPADKLPYVHGGDGTGILDHEMVVLNGDLNYRIDQRREVVESSIKSGDLAYLLDFDQLHREMRGNHAFRLRTFAEAPIAFAPTYKYDPGTDEYDSSDKRRIPAWCDRVLFTKSPRIVPMSYRRYEINVSDHKPVSAGLAFHVKKIDPERMHTVLREVRDAWVVYGTERLRTMAKAYAELY